MTAREGAASRFARNLIERGMILPGARLVDAKKRHGALVRADGRHHARRQGRLDPPYRRGGARRRRLCNGWTFWHIETKQGLRLIDELRAEIRSAMAAG